MKTVVLLPRDRGFESYSLRQEETSPPALEWRLIQPLLGGEPKNAESQICGEMAELAEGARLLSEYTP